MFVFPIGDENPSEKFPFVNYALIVINVLVFLALGFSPRYEDIIMQYGFIPKIAEPMTYITSLFLHGSIMHLIGNMVFLYIVGDNVEDKLGHFFYLMFYLLCGAAADWFHAALATPEMLSVPTVGASGAISAVLGAYIVLFPRNRIKFFYFIWIIIFIYWGQFKLASIWAIGLWFILQLFSQASGSDYSNVAYGAHIGGFMAGVIIVGLLAMMGILKTHWDREHGPSDVLEPHGRNIFKDGF